MEKYNLIQTSSILWIFLNKQNGEWPVPKPSAAGNKNWNASPAAQTTRFISTKLFPFGTRSLEDSSSAFDFYFEGI